MAQLTKEGRITAIALLKSFYDEEVFKLLIKEFYSADLDISLAAIGASASLGNELAIPHLYRILEHGKPAQKTAAVRTLAAINAPSSIGQLIKYYAVLQSPEVRREILQAVNRISPMHPGVGELNRSILVDPSSDEELFSAAIQGLADAGQLELIKPHLAKAPAEVQEAVFRRLLEASTSEAELFIRSFQQEAERFAPAALGNYLCLALLKTEPPQQTFILDLLRSADRGTPAAFLESLSRYNGRMQNPVQVFRMLLRLPYVSPQVEALNGDLTVRILKEVRQQSPLLLNELIFTTATYLENLFGKARRQYLSLQGVKERQSLLVLVLAKTLEMYATPDLLQEIYQYFKSEGTTGAVSLIERVRSYLHFASEEEKRRLDACIPLFRSDDRKLRLQIATTLSQVNLGRPSLLRRLNRLIRVIGTLEIRNSSRKILEVLEFARGERIEFLEETCVVTLCQLMNRVAIEGGRALLSAPRKNPASLNGYIRGARFLPAKIFINPLLQMLLSPGLPLPSRALIVDSLQRMDLAGLKGVLPPLVRALKMPEIPPELKETITGILARFGDNTLFQPLVALSSEGDPAVRRTAIRTLRQIARRSRSLPSDVLTHRLYLYLEDSEQGIRTEALLALLAMGDDYAVQILEDQLQSKDEQAVVELLEGLQQPIPRETVLLLLRRVQTSGPRVQDTLRTLLPDLCRGDFAEEIRQALMDALKSQRDGLASAAASGPTAAASATHHPVDLIQHAKLEFKFRRENSQVLTVFFIDIVSYTEKSSLVDTSTLIRLIQAFEELTIPTITGLKGTVVKKMGDGLLATFKHPFNAALAALTVQQKIREHNQYRLEQERFNVRIGLNTGRVIRKDGDIYGDTVNVASRMETAANAGDILLTQETYEEIKEHVRCTRLGDIQLKGKQEAMTAYSADELLVDVNRMPGPTASTAREAEERPDSTPSLLQESSFTPEFTLPVGSPADPATARTVQALFQDMADAVEDIAHDYHEEYVFKMYLQRRWDELVSQWRAGPESGSPAPSGSPSAPTGRSTPL